MKIFKPANVQLTKNEIEEIVACMKRRYDEAEKRLVLLRVNPSQEYTVWVK